MPMQIPSQLGYLIPMVWKESVRGHFHLVLSAMRTRMLDASLQVVPNNVFSVSSALRV